MINKTSESTLEMKTIYELARAMTAASLGGGDKIMPDQEFNKQTAENVKRLFILPRP